MNILLAIAVIMIFTTSSNETVNIGDLERYSKTVELGGAESVRAEIIMGAGELEIAGGANELLQADFIYNVAEWKPEVEYSVISNQGQLTVQQPSDRDHPEGRIRYEWDLRINNNVPINLSIILGAGASSLDLRGLSLTKLDIITGVGEGIIDLTGDWEQDLEASVTGGIGKVTLLLPKDVGARVDRAGGIGDVNTGNLKRDGSAYINDAYGESAVTLNIIITGGVGQINLELGE
jgi:hypothetical protein